METLSANPVTGTESPSSSDSTAYSDDPDESSPPFSLSEKKMGPDGLSTSKPSPKGSLRQVLVIHEKTDYIKHYANDYDGWDPLLPFAMFAYKTSVHEPTNFAPYKLVFGRIARTPSSFPQDEELETYGSYLHDLIVR